MPIPTLGLHPPGAIQGPNADQIKRIESLRNQIEQVKNDAKADVKEITDRLLKDTPDRYQEEAKKAAEDITKDANSILDTGREGPIEIKDKTYDGELSLDFNLAADKQQDNDIPPPPGDDDPPPPGDDDPPPPGDGDSPQPEAEQPAQEQTQEDRPDFSDIRDSIGMDGMDEQDRDASPAQNLDDRTGQEIDQEQDMDEPAEQEQEEKPDFSDIRNSIGMDAFDDQSPDMDNSPDQEGPDNQPEPDMDGPDMEDDDD